MALDTDEKYGYYEKAIEILPMKSDAYNAVLETMQSDGVFSEAESQEVRKIMPQYMGSLSKNKEVYISKDKKNGYKSITTKYRVLKEIKSN